MYFTEYSAESEKGDDYWVPNGCKYMGCLPLWLCGWPGVVARCYCPASQERIIPHASLGKDPNSSFEVQFLLNACCFHTIIK